MPPSVECSTSPNCVLPRIVGLATLNGSDELDEIAYYDPRGRDFSDDGVHLSGAFGKRLFRYDGKLDQVELILAKLKDDESSRRTAGMILVPQDQVSGSREYPCAIAVQYLLRDGRLDAITFMRSQSAAFVLPYDAFLFMSLHCILSHRLGVEAGRHVHVSGSYHIYDDEVETVNAIIKDEIGTLDLAHVMGKPFESDEFREFERTVRVACNGADIEALNALVNRETAASGNARPGNLLLLIHAFHRLALDERCRQIAVLLGDPVRSLILESLARGGK